jgi:hypothetical protein
LRTLSDIIAPAFLRRFYQEPPTTNWAKNVRGLHHFAPAVLVYFLSFFHHFLRPGSNIGGMCDIIVQRSGSIAKEAMFSRIPGCTETC